MPHRTPEEIIELRNTLRECGYLDGEGPSSARHFPVRDEALARLEGMMEEDRLKSEHTAHTPGQIVEVISAQEQERRMQQAMKDANDRVQQIEENPELCDRTNEIGSQMFRALGGIGFDPSRQAMPKTPDKKQVKEGQSGIWPVEHLEDRLHKIAAEKLLVKMDRGDRNPGHSIEDDQIRGAREIIDCSPRTDKYTDKNLWEKKALEYIEENASPVYSAPSTPTRASKGNSIQSYSRTTSSPWVKENHPVGPDGKHLNSPTGKSKFARRNIDAKLANAEQAADRQDSSTPEAERTMTPPSPDTIGQQSPTEEQASGSYLRHPEKALCLIESITRYQLEEAKTPEEKQQFLSKIQDIEQQKQELLNRINDKDHEGQVIRHFMKRNSEHLVKIGSFAVEAERSMAQPSSNTIGQHSLSEENIIDVNLQAAEQSFQLVRDVANQKLQAARTPEEERTALAMIENVEKVRQKALDGFENLEEQAEEMRHKIAANAAAGSWGQNSGAMYIDSDAYDVEEVVNRKDLSNLDDQELKNIHAFLEKTNRQQLNTNASIKDRMRQALQAPVIGPGKTKAMSGGCMGGAGEQILASQEEPSNNKEPQETKAPSFSSTQPDEFDQSRRMSAFSTGSDTNSATENHTDETQYPVLPRGATSAAKGGKAVSPARGAYAAAARRPSTLGIGHQQHEEGPKRGRGGKVRSGSGSGSGSQDPWAMPTGEDAWGKGKVGAGAGAKRKERA